MEGGTVPSNRKVMVVADPTRESAVALQYVLSHAVVDNDKLILLHVENPNSWRNRFSFFNKPTSAAAAAGATTAIAADGGGFGGGDQDFLEAMKQACELTQPRVHVHVEKVDMGGKDKANIILFQSTLHGVDLLVIGQRRSLTKEILGQRRNGSFRGLDTAECLIEQSKCTCVAVQKRGQNAGYLLNTKTHKNFWLLA